MSAPATSRPRGVLETTPVPDDPGDARTARISLVIDSVVTAALGAIIFVMGFGGDLRRLAGPLGSGDLLQAYATAKLWSDGMPFGDSSLGYPFGMELRYFPTSDALQNTLAGLISAIAQNPFVGLNTVYAFSFPLTALAALWVFRIVGVRGPIAIFSSLAFTAIPFHWLRLEHIYLGTIYSAVLGVGLAILTGTGSIERRLTGRRRWPTIVLLGILSLVVATSGIYYACFTILLCFVALVYRLAHEPSWRGALLSAIPVMSIPVLLGAALTPAFLFERAHPALRPVANRQTIESVVYSGNLAFVLIPAPTTQLPGLKNLNARIENAFTVANASGASGVHWHSNFGSLFTVLALALAGVGLFWSIRRRAHGSTSPAQADVVKPDTMASFGLVGMLLVTAVLFFVPWGLNVIFAALVTPQLRGWDRLVPVLLLLFFTAAMVAWRTMRLPQQGTRAVLIAVFCLVLLVFDSVLPYQANFAGAVSSGQGFLRSGEQYADALNTAIPGKCAMLELPYQPFPEEPNLLALPVYDGFWTALTNPNKKWTFGAMKGTIASEWERVLASDIDASAVSDLVAGGFCGIHVDRRGLTASEDVQVTKRLSTLLGQPVATGHGGDWATYALPATGRGRVLDVEDAAKLPDRLATFFYPPVIAPPVGGTTVGAERDAFGPWWRETAASTKFTIDALDPAAEFSTVTGTLQAGACSPRDASLELRTNNETVKTSFHLEPGAEHDFALRLAKTATKAQLVVSAPGAACMNPDKQAITVALLDAKAR